jgi:hypothetical protein
MIVIDEKLVGMWQVGLPKSDWLAGVREIVPEEKYELVYRFRYYKDEKVFESQDTKNWYKAEVTGSRHYVISSIRAWAWSWRAWPPVRCGNV